MDVDVSVDVVVGGGVDVVVGVLVGVDVVGVDVDGADVGGGTDVVVVGVGACGGAAGTGG